MSSFADSLMADFGRPALMDAFGDPQSVTLTPPSGAPTTLTAIVGNETIEDEPSFDGRRKIARRQITICRDSSCDWGGVANPTPAFKATVGGVEYSVAAISPESATFARLDLVRPVQIEVTRKEYRKG